MLMDKQDPTLDEMRACFAGDRFAAQAGCRILEASEGHAVCELAIDPERHHNLGGSVMGGALFTLADFALAVACNYNSGPTVSVTHTIEFMRAPKEGILIATCDADRRGRTMGFFTVTIDDDQGRCCAKMTATTFTKGS